MANRAKAHNASNRDRQISYLRRRIVMLPTLREELEEKKGKKENGKT